MPNIKSAKKRNQTAERNRLQNQSYQSAVKTLMKKCFAVIDQYASDPSSEKEKQVQQAMSAAYSKIDKAVKVKALHRNNGARKKSRLAKAFKPLDSEYPSVPNTDEPKNTRPGRLDFLYNSEKESYDRQKTYKSKREESQSKSHLEQEKKMVAIKRPFREGFKSLSLHRKFLDIPVSLDNSTAELTQVEISDISERSSLESEHDELAKSYLDMILKEQTNLSSKSFKKYNTKFFRRIGKINVRFIQHHSNIPFYGSLCSVEIDSESRKLISANLVIAEPEELNSTPQITTDDTLEIIKKSGGNLSSKLEPKHIPNLYFFYDSKSTNGWKLAFITHNVKKNSDSNENRVTPEVVDYVVDAINGYLITELSRTQ